MRSGEHTLGDHVSRRARTPEENRPHRPAVQSDMFIDAVEDLAGQFSLRPLLLRILRRAIEMVGGGAGAISTVDEGAGTYRKEADVGVRCQEGQVFSLREGATGAVVTKRGPVVFDSYSQVRSGHLSPADRDRLHATIAVPIEWGGEIIGACVVFSTDPDTRFHDEDIILMDLFARHAALAITNARRYAQAEERSRQLAIVAERERVVRDVHDTVARALGSIMLHLDAMDATVIGGRTARSASEATPAALAAHIDAAREAAEAALADTRRTVLGLGPAVLDAAPLEDAIALELAWVRSTSGLRTDFVVSGKPPESVESHLRQQALRIAQEALTNVVTHARAVSVRVGVMYGPLEISIIVEDDGVGFDAGSGGRNRRPGLGLQGIVARAHGIGAQVEIESTPSWGTRLRARIPYELNNRGDESRSDAPWRVLVVDPRPVVRGGLTRLLGCAEPDIQIVGEIADAREVVDAVRILDPHVVIVQLRMPGLDGARLTSYIRAASPEISVLVNVDDYSDDLLREAVQAGARGCIDADLDGPALARAVVAAAHGDVLLSASLATPRHTQDQTPEPLTEREREVRALVELGLRDKQIADRLSISARTVEKHVGALLRKTGAPNRTALARVVPQQPHR
ncbi:response regulator [Nocardia pseudovaccinii]|uniref:hybrid sensor histidine kinase/response regulator n=1 Tax=Nocardia pseudovaccinii TaxID=189540 RepID=UPI003D8D5988